jgi:hypothetical protein
MASTFVTRLGDDREVTGRNDGKIELHVPDSVYVSLTPKQALWVGMDLVRAFRDAAGDDNS